MNKGYLGHYIQVHHMINNLFRCEKTGKTLFVKDNEVLESKVDEAKAKKSSHQKEYFQLSHNSKVRYPEIELDTVDDNYIQIKIMDNDEEYHKVPVLIPNLDKIMKKTDKEDLK